jgi:hypothetical protein
MFPRPTRCASALLLSLLAGGGLHGCRPSDTPLPPAVVWPDAGSLPDTAAAMSCPTGTSGMQKELFAVRCAGAGCHGNTGAALALDLVSPGLEARLIGAASIGCRGEKLVVAGKPEVSELFRKVAEDQPECGVRMPVGTPAFTPQELECLRRWIAGLSPADAGAGDTPSATPAPDAPPSPDAAADRPPEISCPTGLSRCNGACVDLGGDAVNCGACGKTCAAGTVCSSGACVRGSCPGGTSSCNGACIDPLTSAANCGGCGQACPSGNTCVNGTCTLWCSAGTTACAGACVNTSSDARNCGGCGKTCAAGETCRAGACVGCGPTVSFANQIQPLFNASCTTGCHGGKRPAGGLSLAEGAAYAELVNVTSTCSGRKHVLPGAPASSYLINKLTGLDMCSGSVMPKAGGELPSVQIELIRAWICQGAPKN